MLVRLVLVGTPNQNRAQSISLPAVVGRGPEATLRIPQESVSRRHCEIFSANGAVFVRDLGSTNGTRIGTERLTASAAIAIEPGVVIRAGDVSFRVEYEQATTVAQVVPAAARTEREPAAVPGNSSEPPQLPPQLPPPLPPPLPDELPDDIQIPSLVVSDTTHGPEESGVADAGALPEARGPALPDGFALPETPAAEPTAAFDFIAAEAGPPASEDANLDDFLKGMT
ncbi:MAG: FHA domain-containing protein [Planctomycetia bacterium]|jgi:predicted component of type VI protein secretion system